MCLDRRDENFSRLFALSTRQASDLDAQDRLLAELRSVYTGLMTQYQALRSEYESACKQIVEQAARIKELEEAAQDGLEFVEDEDIIEEEDEEWDTLQAAEWKHCEEHPGPVRTLIMGMAHQCQECMFIMCADCRATHRENCYARKYR